MPIPKKPKLVNRGGAGLYGKLSDKQRERIVHSPNPSGVTNRKAKNPIAPALRGMVVPIDEVIYDPDNARLHPERNVEAITQSLTTFGQVKPIVVQKSTNHVIAGNGTLQCMRALGYTEVAAVFVDMDDAEAASYGLADNKTAELAKWDFETDVLKRLEKKISSAGLPMTGWADHELIVMRMAEGNWIAPTETDDDFEDAEGKVTIKCTKQEYKTITSAIQYLKEGGYEGTDTAALKYICDTWLRKAEEERRGNESDVIPF